MSSARFFAMRRQNGGLSPMLFHDEFVPSRDERDSIVYACPLPAAWRDVPLAELGAAYEKHKADGTLPPSILKAR